MNRLQLDRRSVAGGGQARKRGSLTVASVALLLLTLAGCQESGAFAPDGSAGVPGSGVANARPPGKGPGGKKGSGGDIPLSIAFRDATGDGLASDGGGVYLDGVDRVVALINDPTKGDVNGQGTLSFDAASVKRNQQAVRSVSVTVKSRDASRVLFQGIVDALFSTFNDPDGGSPADFTKIPAGQSQPMVLKVRWTDASSISYTLRFGRICSGTDLVEANKATVTGLTSPPADALWIWHVETLGNAILCNDTDGTASDANVPFSMDLTQLP